MVERRGERGGIREVGGGGGRREGGLAGEGSREEERTEGGGGGYWRNVRVDGSRREEGRRPTERCH